MRVTDGDWIGTVVVDGMEVEGVAGMTLGYISIMRVENLDIVPTIAPSKAQESV